MCLFPLGESAQSHKKRLRKGDGIGNKGDSNNFLKDSSNGGFGERCEISLCSASLTNSVALQAVTR